MDNLLQKQIVWKSPCTLSCTFSVHCFSLCVFMGVFEGKCWCVYNRPCSDFFLHLMSLSSESSYFYIMHKHSYPVLMGDWGWCWYTHSCLQQTIKLKLWNICKKVNYSKNLLFCTQGFDFLCNLFLRTNTMIL